ncbi:hypothetical protein Acr_00g0052580 [Actinidia rufa]|uniref:Uncharacterized protein n=1 Tax=Actinidia rufa TaxID=165716 RepID=A0A7J0DLQ5_9ERIC|nr:hypothetical protein Acr_00g0052580 [Actinidia rufa]
MRDLLAISSVVVFDPDTVLWIGVFSEGGGHPLALGELQELEPGSRRKKVWFLGPFGCHADYFERA